MDLAQPLAKPATLVRHTMGQGVVAVAAQDPYLVGKVLPAPVFMLHDNGVAPDVVRRRRPAPSIATLATRIG